MVKTPFSKTLHIFANFVFQNVLTFTNKFGKIILGVLVAPFFMPFLALGLTIIFRFLQYCHHMLTIWFSTYRNYLSLCNQFRIWI